MRRLDADNHDVRFLANALVWFVFLGAATVAIALAAHVR